MAELFKNLFDEMFVAGLGKGLKGVYAGFDPDRFRVETLAEGWEEAAFKQRIRRIATAMGAQLPAQFTESLEIVEAVAGHYSGLRHLVFPDYVELYGIEHPEPALAALERLTADSTAEFAVRPFILRYPERMYEQLLLWADSADEHVRRLASEGCRPRLPWGIGLPPLKRDPAPILPVLEKLRKDDSLYVRRSVANNLNDIAKDHPQLVLELAARWQGQHPHTDWLIRHGCRTLLKQGRAEALGLFGYEAGAEVHVRSFRAGPEELAMGDILKLECELDNASTVPCKLRIEYGIDFVKANGRSSRKLFKWSDRVYEPGRRRLERSHPFVPVTTRRHYEGEHRIVLVVNGEVKAEASVWLRMERAGSGS